MKQNHKLLLVLGLVNLFAWIMTFFIKSILFIVPILLLSTFFFILFGEDLTRKRRQKKRLIEILNKIKVEIPDCEKGLCWITIDLKDEKAITRLEFNLLRNILVLHRDKLKIIPLKNLYWWPIKDRQSRIDFINSLVKNISDYTKP